MKKTVKNHFTLVELLVVTAIIAVLMGILLPVLSTARKRAKMSKARKQVHALAMAIKQYESDYSLLPWHCGTHITVCACDPVEDVYWDQNCGSNNYAFSDSDKDGFDDAPSSNGDEIKYDTMIEILTGIDGPDSDTKIVNGIGNRRGNKYLSPDSDYGHGKAAYVDPWKRRFAVGLDLDYTGQLGVWPLYGSVFVYSFGPDMEDDNGENGSSHEDDIAAW